MPIAKEFGLKIRKHSWVGRTPRLRNQRKISIALNIPQNGERKAHACAVAFSSHLLSPFEKANRLMFLASTRRCLAISPMQKPDTWYAYFHVRGWFDPDDVTRRVGVSPTETKGEGDVIQGTSQKRPCGLWALHSRVNPSAPLDEHLRDVLDQLDSNRVAFEKLSRELGGTMQLVGYFRDVNPGVHFDLETVRRSADYGLCIDCDFYIC